MQRPQPIDFVRLVSPYVRDTYEMRGTRRQGGASELIWWHPNMRDFLYMDKMSKKDVSLFAAMNIVVNEAFRAGHIELAPIDDPHHPYFVLDIIDRSHYLHARRQVLDLNFEDSILKEHQR